MHNNKCPELLIENFSVVRGLVTEATVRRKRIRLTNKKERTTPMNAKAKGDTLNG